MKNRHCMNCRSTELKRFIDLGNQPNGNMFLTSDSLYKERAFPCVMLVCTQCWQVQIEEFPSAKEMFSDHPYITGLNQPVVVHLDQLAQNIVNKFELPKNSLVLDIGANDGTLLSKFRDRGMRTMGIDPCRQVNKLSRANGITVLQSFWNKQSAEAMLKLGIHPDVITGTAVLYHVEDLHDFIEGLAILMQEDSVFCAQSVYLKDVIEKLQFDHFYHEHTMIHAVGPLQRIFSEHGLRLLDVEFYPIHGGSFVLYVVKDTSCLPTSENIANVIAEEREAGLGEFSTYIKFAEQVEQNKNELVSLLYQLRSQGRVVYGLGAPVKGNTLINYCGIGPELIGCLTEINPAKIGRVAPGSHIPVVDERAIDKQPDYYLILSWNYLDYFTEKYADYLREGGLMIVPHPKVRIIGKDSLNNNFR